MRARRIMMAAAVLTAAAGVAELRPWTSDPRLAEAMATLASAPGSDVVFRDGVVLDRVHDQETVFGRATESTWYGTEAGDSVVTAFFDAELPSRGYQSVPLDAVANPSDRGDPMRELRKYARADGFVYRVLVEPLPRRVGGRSISSGYRQFVITRLTVQ